MEKKILDYGLIRKDVITLMQFFPNTIQRDDRIEVWRKYPDLRHVLYGYTKLAGIYFDGIVHLVGDPKHNEKIKAEYQLCVGPLLRVMLETLTNLVFIKDNLETNLRRYVGTGILDKKRELEFFEKQGEDWEKANTRAREDLLLWMKVGNFSEQQLKMVKNFPNLSGMRRADKTPDLSNESRKFIILVHDWYYPWLSRMGHVTLAGMSYMISQVKDLEAEKSIREDAIEGEGSPKTGPLISGILQALG